MRFWRNRNTNRLFWVSFLILFFELAAIRYIPAQIRYVGYFTNIILLASFVGIGIGTVLGRSLKKLPAYLIPINILVFFLIISTLRYDLVVSSNEVMFFTGGFNLFKGEPMFLLPVIFAIVVWTLLAPSKLLGDLLERLRPLEGYMVNILGSIAGILVFTGLSYLNSGPIIWWGVLMILGLHLGKGFYNSRAVKFIVLLLGIGILWWVVDWAVPKVTRGDLRQIRSMWSPYYKVNLYEYENSDGIYELMVNNIGHQNLHDLRQNLVGFYDYPYVLYPEKHFENVLILGSGAGNDVAKALLEGAERVVAVEIDPTIIDLGRQYHPNNPYGSDKVEVVVDDGRAYMNNSGEKFDLIIYALTDSLTLTSGASNLRLESFLYTEESVRAAKKLLKDDGLVVFYNYYRAGWIVDKLGGMLKGVFGREPYILKTVSEIGDAAILISGNNEVDLLKTEYRAREGAVTPTDDWPFLYLKEPGISSMYWSYWGVILALLGGGWWWVKGRMKIDFNCSLFWLGAGFMLLETKNVVQFSLLFGSTWLTNSMVFMGLLLMVLAAVWLTEKRWLRLPLRFLYLVLALLIAFNYVYEQGELLDLTYWPRMGAAVLINFLPVLVANLIFARLYDKAKIVRVAYGANILGAFAGGLFEYSSLVWGYSDLILFVGWFYALSFLLRKKN